MIYGDQPISHPESILIKVENINRSALLYFDAYPDKTMRAGIFKRIRREDLHMDGKWIEHARDLAIMFPAIEMAGPRAVWCPEILYVYNFATSTEFNGSPDVWAAEKRCVEHVRGLRPYERLEAI